MVSKLKGCGADVAKSYGYDPLKHEWRQEDVSARCGEFQVKVPFEYDQRFCHKCVVEFGLIW